MAGKTQKLLILENIRSTHNVGAILRTADAIGITKVYLAGYTPAPIDRFGRVRSDVAKSALGAETSVPWESVDSAADLVRELQSQGVQVIALEQHECAVDYKTVSPEGDVAIVVGNEVAGVSPEVLALADTIMEIPMVGEKESLNVAVATGVVVFRVFDQ